MNKKGFTLVELLAVIAILAILVIIALPNVLSMF
ncbi:MAG: prepilin-type N-terminal cleavage/methylation domain-containing protein, partial [Tenericutes bacterium]|nr:prepilin-type N-terminal cleavage/methylation domain-containing protein [Mycoplasmatota bacterium]